MFVIYSSGNGKDKKTEYRKSMGTSRKAQKSIVFSILASFLIFARVRILSRFFASYRGICGAKRYKTVVAFWRFAGQED
jgi:hypothetical protein